MTAMWDRLAVIVSFVITSALGCVFLLVYWTGAGHIGRGFALGALFIATMAIVHRQGYLLYRKQRTPALAGVGEETSIGHPPQTFTLPADHAAPFRLAA